MREIRFRAWDRELPPKEKMEMYYFSLDTLISGYGDESAREPSGENVPWDEPIIMQYTGLKDKNGREIYEGDVVLGYWKDSGDKASNVEVVRYENCGFYPLSGTFNDGGLHSEYIDYEVIGNIYENPGLLKESANQR